MMFFLSVLFLPSRNAPDGSAPVMGIRERLGLSKPESPGTLLVISGE